MSHKKPIYSYPTLFEFRGAKSPGEGSLSLSCVVFNNGGDLTGGGDWTRLAERWL